MIVYVGYRYFMYEGCTEPERVFSTKEKAEKWMKENEYREFEAIEVDKDE